MPLGLLELGLQVLLAAHAVRSGRTQPWLYIIMFIPGIGPALYIAMELAPEIFGSYKGRKVTAGIVRAANPGGRYRALLRNVEIAPTVHNKLMLADECMDRGRPDEAAGLYRSCATGLHETDPVVRLGLARALSATGDYPGAIDVLEALARDSPDHRTADGHLLYAAALNGAGRTTEALTQLQALVEYFPGEEARCRYAQLLLQTGAKQAADAQFQEIIRRVELQRGPYKRMQREWYDIARRGVDA